MENAEKFFETYCDFVTKVTSNPSLNIEDLKKSLDDIQDKSSIDAPRLLTAALGLGSETGAVSYTHLTLPTTPYV